MQLSMVPSVCRTEIQQKVFFSFITASVFIATVTIFIFCLINIHNFNLCCVTLLSVLWFTKGKCLLDLRSLFFFFYNYNLQG